MPIELKNFVKKTEQQQMLYYFLVQVFKQSKWK